MTVKNLFKGISTKNSKNSLSTYAVVVVLVVVIAGLGQVLIRNLQGDRASANVSGSYLSQIGITSVDNVANGAFTDSKKICQAIDGVCQADGIIDYDFSSLTERSGVAAATGGGVILEKNGNTFVQNGNLTSKNYVPNDKSVVTLTKIQVGIGLKPETLISVGYSVDGGSNYQTAIGNFSNDQLKAQSNQNVIEYILPTSTKINQGFSYRIALKADSKAQASPSLKYVRVFYDVTSKAAVLDPVVSNYTMITPSNIGAGTCSPASVVIGSKISCTWNLSGGSAGTTYAASAADLPLEQRFTGGSGVSGVLIHSEAKNTQVTLLKNTQTPSESSQSEAGNPGNGTCSVQNNKLVCINIIANGNLTAGNKFVDVLFRGSTPPMTDINELYGNPTITLNTVPITLTPIATDIVCFTKLGSAKVTGQIGGALNPISGLETTCDTDGELTLPGGAKISGKISKNGIFTPNPNQIISASTPTTGNSTLSSFGSISITTNLTAKSDAGNSNAGDFLPVPSGGGEEKPASSK